LSKQCIAVIDYGMGNLHSAGKALEHVAPDATVVITSDITVIENADRVVFPGVGAIRECMTEIRRLGFDVLVPKLVQEKPMLAICVGMQALMSTSEENGGVDCIDIISGNVKRFDSNHLKVPHMGWNSLHHNDAGPMLHQIEQDARFYFVHSYYVAPDNTDIVTGTTEHGIQFASAMSQDNLYAVQFHPEKSHDAGLQLLRNFVSWNGVK